MTVIILMFLFFAIKVMAFDFSLKGSMTEGNFRRYVPPLAQPYFNETPYITTEARLVHIYNEIPNGNPILIASSAILFGGHQT